VENTRLAAEDFLAMQTELRTNFSWASNKNSVYIELDEDKFMQVINNLISNSLKFTRDGGHIHLDIKDSATHVLLSVADDGIGIPEQYHATLFDKFSDANVQPASACLSLKVSWTGIMVRSGLKLK
jgi:two-component system sensor histidine kinase VicK